jgi:ubiquinone/menaquinone biosynthesis C-methylase UbiE
LVPDEGKGNVGELAVINFDERAKDWDSDPAKVERARVVADAIRAAIPLRQDMAALEYGCGTGLLSFALQQEFASITLADTSQGMLDVLARKIQSAGVRNMHPLRLDLSSDPLPASLYGIIYSLMALHHIPEINPLLGQFHTLLEADGYLCISDLEKEDGSFHGKQVTGVHHGFDRAELQRQVESAGFSDVKFSTVYAVRRTVDGSEKNFPLFLMVAEKVI